MTNASIADFAEDVSKRFEARIQQQGTWTRVEASVAFQSALNESLQEALRKLQPIEKVLTE